MPEYTFEDGRHHCPHCRYSTQLLNKFERHMEKRHGLEADAGPVAEANEAVAAIGIIDEEE